MKLSPVVSDLTLLVDALANASGEAPRIEGELDVDVYRVGHEGPGPDWVVRVVDDTLGRPAVDNTARVLAAIAETPFPGERCALEDPVISFDEAGSARHLLVTEFVEPSPPSKPGSQLAWCTGLLASLAARSGESYPAGGGWHRLGVTPTLEIDEALRLASEVEGATGELLDQLADADDGAGLPEAFIHPDLAPPNAIPRGDAPPVIIDWFGAGRGPRLWPLAWLLSAAGPSAGRRVIERYLRSVTLTDEEWQRLPDLMLVRPLTLDAWSVAYERLSVEEAVARARDRRSRVRSTMAAISPSR